MLCLNDILTDIAIRFCRCIGDERWRPSWGEQWPHYTFKHEFMFAERWHYTGTGYYEKHKLLRVPLWLERRKRRHNEELR